MVLIATNTIIIEYQRQEIGLKISVEHLVSVMIKSNDIKQVKLVLRLLSTEWRNQYFGPKLKPRLFLMYLYDKTESETLNSYIGLMRSRPRIFSLCLGDETETEILPSWVLPMRPKPGTCLLYFYWRNRIRI